jgi:hypothetical protein
MRIVVHIAVNESAPAKGLATSVAGRLIEVSILNALAGRLSVPRPIDPGAKASLVFHSLRYGESPRIDGVVTQISESGSETRLQIEVLDWQELATFWRGALYGS